MAMLLVGSITLVAGLIFALGCFIRVDSPSFTANMDGPKIARMHTLQRAWDSIGRSRQVLASSYGYVVFAFLLLLTYLENSLRVWLLVPLVFWCTSRFSAESIATLPVFWQADHGGMIKCCR